MVQIFVSEAACAKEQNLELFRIRDKLSVWTECFRLAFCWLSSLIKLVRTLRDRIPSFELFRVDGVPVKEEVRDWTAFFCKVSN